MREDYTFYNCYCNNNDPIDFKAYVLNELRNLNYFPLEDKPAIASKEVYLEDIKEQCEDIIKRSQNWISDNKRNIERMKKQDEATHKLFESLKVFDKELLESD